MGVNYDYRYDYFKRHKGILGSGIYFCSYCGKPITKKNAHIDHIIPKSKGEAVLNNRFNTTIACRKCNLRKSDKIDYRVLQGYASKVGGAAVGGVVGTAAHGVTLSAKGAMFGIKSIWGIFHLTFKSFKMLFNTLKWILWSMRWIIILLFALYFIKR